MRTSRPARASHWSTWASGHAVEITWTLFAAANLAAMLLYPGWVTIPFHLIWVSFALLYGLRTWGTRSTVLALFVVGVAAGVLITMEGLESDTFPSRVVEVPLMTAMFAAMVWHTRRHVAAMHRVREVSRTNRELLEREHRFVQNASHELRTPIAVALGHADLLARALRDGQGRDGQGPGRRQTADLAIVIDELLRLRRLTDQLLSLATLDGEETLDIGPVEANGLLEETLRRWTPIERTWSLGPGHAPIVDADLARLRAALDALVDNAVKHTTDGDAIQLSATAEGDACAITVTDTGPGIPPHALDHIFDRFARAGSGPRRENSFGLGLSLVKAVAEAHGGSVRATTGNAGTSVTMLLPSAIGAAAAGERTADAAVGAGAVGAGGPDEAPVITARGAGHVSGGVGWDPGRS